MDGSELLELMPKVVGFFRIDSYPGTIGPDNQGWIFEGGPISPRPITRGEAEDRDAVDIDADEAAELFNQQPGALDFLKKNDQSQSSTDLTSPETRKESLRMKVRVVKNRDT